MIWAKMEVFKGPKAVAVVVVVGMWESDLYISTKRLVQPYTFTQQCIHGSW